MTKQNITQFSVPVKNEPGTLYKVTQVLSKEGINITGIMTESLGDVAYVRFLAEKENGIHKLLENAGFEVLESQVFHLELHNRPGEMNKVAKSLADEEINILSIYGTTNGNETAKVVLVVDRPEKAQRVLAPWAEKAFATR